MPLIIDIKLLLAVTGSIIALLAYYPYIKSILKRQTKPHAYSWLIWSILLGTATVASIQGGAGFATIGLAILTIADIVVLLLSLKYGTKDITKSDTTLLTLALLAIILWWQLDSPLIAVFMVSAIDAVAHIPTYRKTFHDPYSESVLFWIAIFLSYILTLLASAHYSLLTVTYLATLTVASIGVILISLLRRSTTQKAI